MSLPGVCEAGRACGVWGPGEGPRVPGLLGAAPCLPSFPGLPLHLTRLPGAVGGLLSHPFPCAFLILWLIFMLIISLPQAFFLQISACHNLCHLRPARPPQLLSSPLPALYQTLCGHGPRWGPRGWGPHAGFGPGDSVNETPSPRVPTGKEVTRPPSYPFVVKLKSACTSEVGLPEKTQDTLSNWNLRCTRGSS